MELMGKHWFSKPSIGKSPFEKDYFWEHCISATAQVLMPHNFLTPYWNCENIFSIKKKILFSDINEKNWNPST